MSAAALESQQSVDAGVTPAQIERVERSLIDASMRGPVLFLYAGAILWLLAASLLGFVASIKVHLPEFLGVGSWLTYGRIWPAYGAALAYGWAVQAAIGTALWIFARLCRVAVRRPGWIICGALLWNFGVLAGELAILSGNGTGCEWLEFPSSVRLLLFVAYLVIAAWGVVMFRARRPGHVFISIWYLLAAFLWFPWLLGSAGAMLGSGRLHGVMQAVVAAWYAQSFLHVFLTCIGLGVIYYLIPKITGRAIHSYSLASMGFWGLLFLGSWTGMTRLVGAPIPAWMITVGIAASLFTLVPVAMVTANYALSMRGSYHLIFHSPAIRFSFYGAVAFTVAHLLQALLSFRSVQSMLAFSFASVGQSHLVLYSFVSMSLFGAMYFIIPRLVGCEWFSPTMIRIHFWGSAYGMGLIVFILIVSGLMQGGAWADPNQTVSTASLSSEFGLVGASVAWLLLIPAHFVFAMHFLMMVLRLGRPGGEPTLFNAIEEEPR
jgi:cytochrome c oxidase cbb3-type subunit I